METDNRPPWIEAARSRGWAEILGALLDAFEPLAPLGAQMLWVAQPALAPWVGRDTLASLARSLEQPGGVAALRRQLEEPPDEP